MKLINGITILLVVFSLFFFLFSLIYLLRYDSLVSFSNSVNNIYSAISTYSGLYKFTFIVLAFSVALRQLKVSQANYETTLKQIDTLQKDASTKNKKETNYETLKLCQFFSNELQVSFTEFIAADILKGMEKDYSKLVKKIKSEIENDYPFLYEKLESLSKEEKSKVLITIYKLEAFSTWIIKGNVDKELAKKIIGGLFIKQVGFLLGVISYFRSVEGEVFLDNTIELYNNWKQIIEE